MNRGLAAVVVALCILATACSASDPSSAPIDGTEASPTSENYVGFDDEEPTPAASTQTGDDDERSSNQGGAATTADPTPTLSDTERSQLEAELAQFMATRDLIVIGEAELGEISDRVSREVRGQIEAERTLNLAHIEDAHRDARYGYESTPHLLGASKEGALLRADVCVDRRGARWNGNIDGIAARQEFLFDAAGDSWILREITTDHDGRYGTPGLTCVPPSVEAMAVETTRGLLEQIEAVLRNPSTLSTTDFSQYAGGTAEFSVIESLQAIPQDQQRVTPTEFSFRAVGIFPDLSPYHVSISACRYYPEGAINQVPGTDDRVPAIAGVIEGTSVEDRFIVFVDVSAEDGSTTASVLDLEPSVALGCWQG